MELQATDENSNRCDDDDVIVERLMREDYTFLPFRIFGLLTAIGGIVLLVVSSVDDDWITVEGLPQ